MSGTLRGSLRSALSGLLLLCSCASGPADEQGDVVLITIDTLRPDHLGLYGYPRRTSPNLDRWFADGAIFERAYSTDANTPPSVVSILTGLLPQDHRVRIFYQLLPDGIALIPDLLPPAYQSAAFVSNLVLTDEAMGLARHFDHFDDFVDERESKRLVFERSARRTTDAVLRWIREERDPARPLFLWVHYIDPHGPYAPPDDWPLTFHHQSPAPVDTERILPYQRIPGEVDGLVYVDRYDEEIAYTDAQIGRLLDAYARTRHAAGALLIFTADHGESMMEHEKWFAHSYQVYEEIVRVPLAIRGPGVAPGIRSASVSTIDLAPTILAFAGTLVPGHLPGVDLESAGASGPQRVVFVEATDHPWQWRAAIQGKRKWIVRVERGTGRIDDRRYYDLRTDPRELQPGDWPEADPAAAQLISLAKEDRDPGGLPAQYRKGLRLQAPKVSPRASDDALERLRALGYAD